MQLRQELCSISLASDTRHAGRRAEVASNECATRNGGSQTIMPRDPRSCHRCIDLRCRVGATLTGVLAAAAFSLASAQGSPASPSLSDDGPKDANAIAGQLANPVAKLISVPFQFNYDRGIGERQQGRMVSLKFQPVVPISVNENWNLITRPIVTTEWQRDVDGSSGTGVGPIALETFFSPAAAARTVWGVGPFLSTPSLSGNRYGTRQWGAGASFVGMVRPGAWTIGVLGYQSWNVGGSGEAGTANNTYWQPFMSYVTRNAWTYTLDTESTFNWDTRRASNPMNAIVSKLVYVGKMPVSLAAGARYYLTSTPGGPSGWGGRATITFVFPE